MKKIVVIALCIITFFIGGCKPREYTFPNKNQPVEKIELLYNSFAEKDTGSRTMDLICTLEHEQIDTFLNAVYCLDTNRCITPPPTDYGVYVARVVYQNGDVEMFGSRHIEFIEKGDTPKAIGEYYFSGDAFDKLFLEYAEKGDGSP